MQNAAKWNVEPPSVYQTVEPFRKSTLILEEAQKEISTTGTLSAASYAAIYPMLREIVQHRFRGAGEFYSSSEPKIDAEFIASLKASLESMIEILDKAVAEEFASSQQREEDYYAENALAPEAIMNKILRYERSVQRKLDWVLQKLLESQQRRKNSQAPS